MGKMIILIWIIVFILLVLFASVTQNMLFLGMALISIGLLFFFLKMKGMALATRAVCNVGIYACLWGALTIAASMANSAYEGWIFAEGFGGMFLLLGIYQGFVKAVVCREKAAAVYLGAKLRGTGVGTYYEPLFSFKYQNRQYQRTTGEIFRRRKLKKRYQAGREYTIYINPQNPNIICTKRYPSGASVLMICLGIVYLATPFWMNI